MATATFQNPVYVRPRLGGVMPYTGIAKLHAGETVIPHGGGAMINVIIEGPVYGWSDFEQMVDAVVSSGLFNGAYRGLS